MAWLERTAAGPGSRILHRVRSSLRNLPSAPSEDLLLQAYLETPHPEFPILPLIDPKESFPPFLMSAVLSSSLSHKKELRVFAPAIWSFVQSPNVLETGLDAPRLSSIAAAMLSIGARPVVDVRGNYLTLARVSAQLWREYLAPSFVFEVF